MSTGTEGKLFLHVFCKDSKDPLFCTLDSMEEMTVTPDGFYIFPSLRGKRFMVAKDNLSRIEVQDNHRSK